MTDLARQCWFLTGPTASGKSAVGLALARQINAEIIALDSMSLYRGMDIGTAKPSAADRAEIPHHLVDIVAPSEEFSLAQYVAVATAAAADIRQRGAVPLFVGGTPLYLKALLRGIFVGPAADVELRERLRAEAESAPPGYLYARLTAVDPAAAARLEPADTRRLIRAIEVYEKTGRPISDWQRQFSTSVPREECRVFVLDWERSELYRRIEERVDAMFAAGLVDEVRRLAAEGLSRTAAQAVGYREVIEFLDVVRASARPNVGVRPSTHGRKAALLPAEDRRPSLEETIALVKQHTRQLAKRQLTWFRSLSECRWVRMSAERTIDDVAREVCG